MSNDDYENATVQSLSVLASMGFQIITKDGKDLTEKLRGDDGND